MLKLLLLSHLLSVLYLIYYLVSVFKNGLRKLVIIGLLIFVQ